MSRKSLIDKKYALELLQAGIAPKQVAERTGYSLSSVYNIRYEHIGHTGAKRNQAQRNKIVALYMSGKKQTEIAKEMGLSRQRVNQIIKDERYQTNKYLFEQFRAMGII